MIAVDAPTAVLVLGVLVLCFTTAVTALGIPTNQRSKGRRRRTDSSRNTQQHPPVVARRVVTGRPASMSDAAPPAGLPRAMGAIELPVPPTPFDGPLEITAGRIVFPPDHLPQNADEAEAIISQLVDDDPERMADLMMKWMNLDEASPHDPDTITSTEIVPGDPVVLDSHPDRRR